MKSTTTPCLHAALTGVFLATAAHGTIVAPLSPNPITTWTPMADTGSAAMIKHTSFVPVTTFTGFSPPVIIGSGTGTGFPQIAFKGQMLVSGSVTIANNEGIWSNGDPRFFSSSPPGTTSWMVAQEGDVVSGVAIGDSTSNTLLVRALQTTFYGGTLITTDSTAAPGVPHFSVYEGGSLNGLAGVSISGFTNGGRAVTDGNRIAAWAKIGAPAATRYWDVTAPGSGLTHTPSAFASWPSSLPALGVQCSPAITEFGAVAHRDRIAGPPFFRQDCITANPISPSGLFPASVLVVRRNDLARASERFGIFHPNLMAITGGPNIAPTVAWQMSNMYTNTGSLGVLGTLIPSSNSLWCWRRASGITPYGEIARAGQAAPDITGRTFGSFHSLYLVDDHTTYGEADAFYGVILNSLRYAIYTRHISTVLGVTTLGPEQLIATDDPSGPAALSVPAIFPAGTPYPITNLFRWFSVDQNGNVLIKATLGSAAAGQKQCLIAAMSGTNHALEMRAQSNLSVFSLPTLTHGPQAITNFFITNPEQGPLGRGQAINGARVGAVVNFTGGNNGVYIGQ